MVISIIGDGKIADNPLPLLNKIGIVTYSCPLSAPLGPAKMLRSSIHMGSAGPVVVLRLPMSPSAWGEVSTVIGPRAQAYPQGHRPWVIGSSPSGSRGHVGDLSGFFSGEGAAQERFFAVGEPLLDDLVAADVIAPLLCRWSSFPWAFLQQYFYMALLFRTRIKFGEGQEKTP